ncbi:unnamed protein product [Candida verbasci]|uniref:Uncharacterized protein n=1 Tax=Candida verbasci TaxID=1227364 RepID=A0A9W4XHK0_9ASCO|nr:unnamed protein product [Candida verbasci]
MDNKDKLKQQLDNNNNTPYSFTGKLKGLLKNSWLINNKKESSSSIVPSSFIKPFKFDPPQTTLPQYKLPGAFNNNITPAKEEVTVDPDQSTNEILSNFFKRKGDKPLNDIEYEGVMSLINKSKLTTPNINSSMIELSRKRLNESEDEDVSHLNRKSKQQKLIKRDPNTTINTPGYKPNYKSINESTFDNFNNTTISHLPHLKRVFEFNGVPSPYRTKIRPPVLKRKPEISKNHQSMTIDDSIIKRNDNMTFSEDNKPKSETARGLLDVLDKEKEKTPIESKSEGSSDKLKLFINPYGASRKKSKPVKQASQLNGTTKKRSICINANDIEKTKNYDKSESLPTISKLKPENNGTTTIPKSKFNFEFPKPELIKVELDNNKINKYKKLFEF